MYEQNYQTVKLDTADVLRSKWANRHDHSFADKEFLKLKEEICNSGGNVQPIKVRPCVGTTGKFEIIFGHRRHQACFELGISVLAMIENVTDRDLFEQMDRENRERKNLRPFEQGVMYAKALDEGLFSSARKMAESLGVDLGSLGRSLAIARLPAAVLAAFPSPLDIQLKWSSDLSKALQKYPELVLARAREFQAMTPRPAAKAVLAGLLAAGGRTALPPHTGVFKIRGKSGELASINLNTSRKKVTLSVTGISADRARGLQQLISSFL